MRHQDFKKLIKDLKLGDNVCICVRGNAEDYLVEGLIFRVDENSISLNHGFTHRWQRVISIKKLE